MGKSTAGGWSLDAGSRSRRKRDAGCRLLLRSFHSHQPTRREVREVIGNGGKCRGGRALPERLFGWEPEVGLAIERRRGTVEIARELDQRGLREADLLLESLDEREMLLGVVLLERGGILGGVVDHGDGPHERLQGRGGSADSKESIEQRCREYLWVEFATVEGAARSRAGEPDLGRAEEHLVNPVEVSVVALKNLVEGRAVVAGG